jgi:hypothetical protein
MLSNKVKGNPKGQKKKKTIIYISYFIFVMTSQCSFRKALKDKLDKSIVYLKTIKT